MDIQRYLREVTPLNLLEIIDLQVLGNLLNGYSFALGSGITVMYPTSIPVTIDTLERINARGDEAKSTFHPLCAFWRDDKKGCNKDDYCILKDKEEALKYYNGAWEGPRVYRCQPLSLWDMTFPLRIKNQIVGILFGGQIIVKEEFVSLQEVLGEYIDIIDWSTCPKNDDHVLTIKETILKHDIPQEKKTELIETLMIDPSSSRNKINLEEFKNRIDNFIRFGDITQGLLDELHKARKTAAEQQLLHEFSAKTVEIHLADQQQWWRDCSLFLEEMENLLQLEIAMLYIRVKSRFICQIQRPTIFPDPRPLHARDIIRTLPTGQLTPVPHTGNENLLTNLGLGGKNIWGYHSETGTGHELCSTIIILRGNISEAQYDFSLDLCSVICKAADTAQLIFREREADKEYQHRTGLIGHSFRTPLQALQFILEDIENSPLLPKSSILHERVKSGMARILDAKEDLSRLLESKDQKEEEFDIIKILNYVIPSMEPIAEKHPCCIIKRGDWPPSVFVLGIRYRVQRAIACLLDNAIKYSYFGYRKEYGGLYEVRVQIDMDSSYFNILITNYGIGIPKIKLKIIKEYGLRGEIEDIKKKRLGTGRGLPFAIEVFEESGGGLFIDSIPDKKATEKEKSTYHRYLTIVEAFLPISRRN